jgi:hypothetical protein
MIEKIRAFFEKHEDTEYNYPERVKNKRSQRPDLNALILLDELCPGSKDIIASAYHGQITLSMRPTDLAKVATEDQVIELIRCGLRIDDDADNLVMWL